MKKRISVLLLFAISGFTTNLAIAQCDIAAGKKEFNKCIACHSVEAGVHMAGPSLHGIMGRKVGSAEGFLYSPTMEQADFVWNSETLSAFLENPMQNMPGTTMPFGGLRKPEQREAIDCFLQSLAGK